jgi:sulfur relay protein TusB/DsrH
MNNSIPAKTCLHLVMRSSAEALDSCCSQWGDGDAVLFLDDGVMVIARYEREVLQRLKTRSWSSSISFSAVDLEARGLSGLAKAAGATVLTDAEIAGLLQSHDLCLSWK